MQGPPDERKRIVQLDWGGLSRLAQELGRSVGHLSRFFSGERQSRRLAEEIERRLGVPASQVQVTPRDTGPKTGRGARAENPDAA